MVIISKPCYYSFNHVKKIFFPTVIRRFGHVEIKQLKQSKHDVESYLNKKSVKNQIDPIGHGLVIIPLTCFGLAIWQYNRKQWKETLIADMKLKTFIPAIDLPQDLTNTKKLEYRRVKVKGTFDHSKEMYISPRSLIEDNEFYQDGGGFLNPLPKKGTSIGAVVVTPFKLSDRDLTILVNRGWIPIEKINPETRLEAQIEGEVELEGIVRLKETKPAFVDGKHNTRQRLFKYRDIEELAEMAESSFLYIDAVKETTISGGPIGGQTQIQLKNDHFQYMVTWIAIGSYLSFMWYKRWIRKLN